MFGKEYASHLDILIDSFIHMNANYKKTKYKNKIKQTLINYLKKIYVLIFGIPEIGFQVRSLYFSKILDKYNLKKKNIKKILDAGSGIGSHCFFLARVFKKAKITGGDIDKNKLKVCKTMTKELGFKNVDFVYFNILKKQFRSKYDLIVTIDVLEHVNNYTSAVKNFYKLLHNDGYLLVHVPQPNQKRIFKSLKKWRHEGHTHEGINAIKLTKTLKNMGFKIITSKITYGLFGKIAWEINHLMLSKNFFLAGITFPMLYILVILDSITKNGEGLGIMILAKKI